MTSVGTRVREAMSVPPRKYQIQAARFLEFNEGRGILGDGMGLGKTYEAISWLKINGITHIVVVCPAAVKYQWQDMFEKWARMQSCVLEGRTPYLPPHTTSIINYDILAAATWPKGKRRKKDKPTFPWVEQLRSRGLSAVVLDEFHMVKNRQALRTQASKALTRWVPHVIGCSGTPIEKSPVEYFPILQMIAPHEFRGFWKYAQRYCAPKRAFRGRGWDFSGADHLDELHERTAPWIIRRLKKDVAHELPDKIRTVLPVSLSNRDTYDEAESNFLEWVERTKGEGAAEKAAGAVGLAKLGALKRVAGLGKSFALKRWIRDHLEENEDKLVVFATHHDVINQLKADFPSSAIYTGHTPSRKRPAVIRRFQEDPSCRVFVGQLKAAGVGVDGLHRVASTVLFAELGWNFSEHEQAEDRVLRLDQKASIINIYYMVGRETVEEPILDLIQDKADIVSKILSGSVMGPLFHQRRRNAGFQNSK